MNKLFETMRKMNPEMNRSERQILSFIFHQKANTQAKLVDESKLTQQSVSRILSNLQKTSMITTGDKTNDHKRGYPSTNMVINANFGYSIGVAINVGYIAVSLIDFSGQLRGQTQINIMTAKIDATLNFVKQAQIKLCQETGFEPNNIIGMGIAVSGSFIEGGGFNTPYQLEEWASKDIAAIFHDYFKIPTIADNDGNCAAVAESIAGAGKHIKNFAYLYLSTGVGGGVILDGELWRGRFGNAGEFAGGLPPNIYPFPNLELLRQLVAAEGKIFGTVIEMVQNFNSEWHAIDDWISRVRDSLSIISSNATAILDIDAIILGGQIPKSLALKTIPKIELYDQKRRMLLRPVAKIIPSELNYDAASAGAAIIAIQTQFFKN